MKYKDIEGLTVEEIKKRVRESSEELFNMKMKNTLGQLGNPLQIRTLRRDVARFKTALNQKSGN
ncbi:MAG: 50S ribosomal protein L29 [Bdellovibrionales bacterium]|nr:50S ribosomal protein L29 [Bdellovibrionales bacterium]